MAVPLSHYLIVAAILFTLGIFGIFLNRKNIIIILMSIELMLLAINLNLVAFSAYLGSFNSYNRIYGSIGTVVALLMWFYLAGFSVLLGALINVELARRRRMRAVREARRGFTELLAEKNG